MKKEKEEDITIKLSKEDLPLLGTIMSTAISSMANNPKLRNTLAMTINLETTILNQLK